MIEKEMQYYNLGKAYRYLMDAVKEENIGEEEMENAKKQPLLSYTKAAIYAYQKNALNGKLNRKIAACLRSVHPEEIANKKIPEKNLIKAWETGFSDVRQNTNKLCIERKRRNLTQRELAKKINKKQTEISRWERGVVKVSPKNLKRIAMALDCEIEDLIE